MSKTELFPAVRGNGCCGHQRQMRVFDCYCSHLFFPSPFPLRPPSSFTFLPLSFPFSPYSCLSSCVLSISLCVSLLLSLLPGAALYLKRPVQPKLFLQLLGRGAIKV